MTKTNTTAKETPQSATAPKAPTTTTRPCGSFRQWKHRRVFCFCVAGVAVVAAVLASVLLSRRSGVTASIPLGRGFSSLPSTDAYDILTEDMDGRVDPNGNDFTKLIPNEVKDVCDEPISTFSADVDTASYSYCRRSIYLGFLPEAAAVRTEEMINYFDFEYPLPDSKDKPFNPVVRVSESPWNVGRKLLHVGIKGYDLAPSETRPSNLVFLLDVSGSMSGSDRLDLVKESIELLLSALDPDLDTVSIVTYASGVRVVLEPTPVHMRDEILRVVRELRADGYTNGAGGLELAYEMVEKNFDENGVNRIILATDGDFNVGMSDPDALKAYVEEKRDNGIFLSVLGFGYGNYKDTTMKALANHGNGVAAYIDNANEAKKILVTEAKATLFPIAKDVKFQLIFNPLMVSAYRLIGYEKRLLKQEDFDNDTVDAGEIGSGHTVTVIYEFDPAIGPKPDIIDKACNVSESQYVFRGDFLPEFESDYALLKIRYKLPDEEESRMTTRHITRDDIARTKDNGEGGAIAQNLRGSFAVDHSLSISQDFDFATAVAGFAQLLQGGDHLSSDYSFDDVLQLAENSMGKDEHGYRNQFIQIVQKAKQVKE